MEEKIKVSPRCDALAEWKWEREILQLMLQVRTVLWGALKGSTSS